MRSLLLFLAALMMGQDSPPQPGRILGKAVNAVTNEPLRKAAVHLKLQKSGNADFATTTDNDGAFLFENLPPGDYRLSGEKSGFLRTLSGARTASSRGSLITVTAGTDRKDILLKLIPAAIVSGRVLDEDGEPIEGAVVSALLKTEVNGAMRWEKRYRAIANERGEFRISAIQPGPVRISVESKRFIRPANGAKEEFRYPVTYFPGVDSVDQAQTLQLRQARN